MKKLQKGYEYLTSIHAFWDRKDKNHIWVRTSGCLTADCHEIESNLMKFGFHAIDRKFDNHSSQTITIYKHK